MFAAFGPGAALTLAGSTAASETRDIVERGGTAEQAALGGFAAGTAEYIFEKMGIDSLLDLKYVKNPEDWLKRALKQGGVDDVGVDGAGVDNAVAADGLGPDVAGHLDTALYNKPVGHQRFVVDGFSLGNVNGFMLHDSFSLFCAVSNSHSG